MAPVLHPMTEASSLPPRVAQEPCPPSPRTFGLLPPYRAIGPEEIGTFGLDMAVPLSVTFVSVPSDRRESRKAERRSLGAAFVFWGARKSVGAHGLPAKPDRRAQPPSEDRSPIGGSKSLLEKSLARTAFESAWPPPDARSLRRHRGTRAQHAHPTTEPDTEALPSCHGSRGSRHPGRARRRDARAPRCDHPRSLSSSSPPSTASHGPSHQVEGQVEGSGAARHAPSRFTSPCHRPTDLLGEKMSRGPSVAQGLSAPRMWDRVPYADRRARS